MPVRALWAALSLVFALSPRGHAAMLRDHLYGVKAMSATEAWAVGNYGSIYHTTNGGQTWDTRDSGTKLPLFSVDFVDATHGWAAGKSAELLATSDGGKTWTPQPMPIDRGKHFFKVRAADARSIWAVGDWGAIAASSDGGNTWKDRSLSTLTVLTGNRNDRVEHVVLEDVILYDVAWPDPQHGYIAGEFATLLATSDGGQTWYKRTLPTEKTIFGLSFVSADEGWAVGIDGLVLHTTDAGRTWTVQHGNPAPATIDELAFKDALKNPGMYAVSVVGETGVVVGDTGTLLVSSDGGQTWSRRVLPDRERYSWLRDVSLVPGSRGMLVGARGMSGLVQGSEVTLSDGGKAVAATE